MDFGWCCSYNLPKKTSFIFIYIYTMFIYIYIFVFPYILLLEFFLDDLCRGGVLNSPQIEPETPRLASFHPTRARCLVARGASSVSGPEFFPVGRGAVESETS